MKLIKALFASILGVSLSAQATIIPVSIEDVANFDLSDKSFTINGDQFPTGNQTYAGIDFDIDTTNIWSSYLRTDNDNTNDTRTVDINVDEFGVTHVYSLISTFWGENDPTISLAQIEFIGTNGASHIVQLDGGSVVRDYNFNPTYTTTLDPTIAQEVWNNGTGAGSQHYDMQTFSLPMQFANETLQTIRITDNGQTGIQRTFLTALTVKTESTVSTPGTLGLVSLSFLVLARIKRK